MPQLSSPSADVVVVGGGIIGCTIAWRLAQAGAKVTVLDRSEPGAEASSAAAGMLAPVGEMITPQAFSDICVASLGLYGPFAAEVQDASGQDVGYRRDGALLLALNDSLEEELTEVHRAQSARGCALQPLTAQQVHAHGLGLSPKVRSGLFIPGDHSIDNEHLMRALIIACQRHGVRLEAGQAVQRFFKKGDRIEGVAAGGGTRYTAQTYVLAAGCWSGELTQDLGVNLPVVPCCGQMMEFEGEAPFIVRAGIHYFVPRAQRRLLLGTTSEYTGFSKLVTADRLLSVLSGVVDFAPRVRHLRFLRAWAGLRPDTADHLPILGYGEIKNLIFATGHFRNGILLAPITAEIVADLILKGATSRPIEDYRPTRFKAEKAAGTRQ